VLVVLDLCLGIPPDRRHGRAGEPVCDADRHLSLGRLDRQRDRVVASYTVLAAAGRLSPQVLQLDVPIYDAKVHYHQVRDSWVGVRTPDGK